MMAVPATGLHDVKCFWPGGDLNSCPITLKCCVLKHEVSHHCAVVERLLWQILDLFGFKLQLLLRSTQRCAWRGQKELFGTWKWRRGFEVIQLGGGAAFKLY